MAVLVMVPIWDKVSHLSKYEFPGLQRMEVFQEIANNKPHSSVAALKAWSNKEDYIIKTCPAIRVRLEAVIRAEGSLY